MEKYNYRKDPHQDIDHVFRDLLPAHGMVERPAQVELSHQMLDTMLNGSIALCDAGTGIGKTYDCEAVKATAMKNNWFEDDEIRLLE